MKPINELDVFVPEVPLLEESDLVKGGEQGPSNAQALALASRTHFLNERRKELETELDRIDTALSGLDADKVGADAKGTATGLIDAHVKDADPHIQYLTDARGKLLFVDKTTANKPNGYLQLDANGKLPAGVVTSLSARYVIVADETERLKLTITNDLTIAAQQSDDTLYYLNAGTDPSVKGNWIKGQSATVSGVVSFFGRTGVITAESGDYTADQINETLTRLFVSPQEKQTWNQKQDKLVSGTNIKTFKGQSLVGAGDLSFNYADFGAAAEIHKHVASDITDFNDKVDGRASSLLKAGQNIQLVVDPTTKAVTINAAPPNAASLFASVDRMGSAANQMHVINFNQDITYNLEAYALKLEKGSTNQVYTLETFDPTSAPFFNSTQYLTFNGVLGVAYNWTPTLRQNKTRYEMEFDPNVNALSLFSTAGKNIIPVMAGNGGINGYVPFASSEYSADYTAYRAFSNLQAANGASDCWASGKGQVPSAANPQWIGISLPAGVKITAYSFVNRSAGAVSTPSKYKLQGSNDKTTWDDIEAVRSNTNDAAAFEFFHSARPTKAYQHYRLYITERYPNNPDYDFVVVWRLRLYVEKPVVFQGETSDALYTLDSNNVLVPLTDISDAGIEAQGISVAKNIPPANLLAYPLKKIVGLEPSTLNVKLVPMEQIAIMKDPLVTKPFSKINAMNYTAVLLEKTRYAISPDGVTFYTYNGGTWTSLGALKNDLASAKKLAAQGMMNGLATGTIMTLYTQLGIRFTAFSLAYGIFPTVANEVISVDQTLLSVDFADTWKKQTPAEVEIRYSSGNISFKTVAAGDYKLVYQVA
ncbi:putative carbohydrate binding protein [Erwinia phage vB_EamM_Joad]|uniref:Putative carbohydrate binding protein n=1 Tax=Erwinia phage vB_EamM_Joad TaxID=2026081 RepID=A0A223LIZ4_9CAUD|nr:putative carbohydrate binding protein [Erwinia phage vB_EamM_Joad]